MPLSFGIAVFLTELCPGPLRRPLGTAVELLAAVPSIIYGMFGLFIFAPLFGEYIQPALAATLGQIPGLGILFSGAFNGIGILCAGPHFSDDDSSFHRLSYARCVWNCSAGSERVSILVSAALPGR